MSFTFHPGRPKLAWGGCPVFDGMTEERCQIMMKEKKVCSLCPEYRREKKRKYYIKEAFAALSLLLIPVGTANALGVSSVWHGKVYSPAARQYGNIQVIDETGQVVKTLTLKPFPNRSTTTSFANWSTAPTPGTYTLFFNLSSANGKLSYAKAVQVEQTATVNVDPTTFWSYTGSKAHYLDAPISSRSSQASMTNISTAQARGFASLPRLTDIVNGVWSAGARTLTSFGSLVSDVWTWAVRTVTGGTMDTVSGPVVLSGAYDKAKTAAQPGDAMAVILSNQTGIVAQADRRLSRTHPGDWAATGSGGGTAFINWSTGAAYFAQRFGNGPWGAAGQFNIIGLDGKVTPPYAAEGVPVTVKRGDSIDIPYNVHMSLVGKTVWFGGGKNPAGSVREIPIRDITAGVTDVTAGKGFIHLTGQDTASIGEYICEIEVDDGAGNVQTPVTFKLRIISDVIRRVQ